MMGFPTQLLYYDGDYNKTWSSLERGEAHIYPEAWVVDDGTFASLCGLVRDCGIR
jgi:hypothetical protein